MYLVLIWGNFGSFGPQIQQILIVLVNSFKFCFKIHHIKCKNLVNYKCTQFLSIKINSFGPHVWDMLAILVGPFKFGFKIHNFKRCQKKPVKHTCTQNRFEIFLARPQVCKILRFLVGWCGLFCQVCVCTWGTYIQNHVNRAK